MHPRAPRWRRSGPRPVRDEVEDEVRETLYGMALRVRGAQGSLFYDAERLEPGLKRAQWGHAPVVARAARRVGRDAAPRPLP